MWSPKATAKILEAPAREQDSYTWSLWSLVRWHRNQAMGRARKVEYSENGFLDTWLSGRHW